MAPEGPASRSLAGPVSRLAAMILEEVILDGQGAGEDSGQLQAAGGVHKVGRQ